MLACNTIYECIFIYSIVAILKIIDVISFTETYSNFKLARPIVKRLVGSLRILDHKK